MDVGKESRSLFEASSETKHASAISEADFGVLFLQETGSIFDLNRMFL